MQNRIIYITKTFISCSFLSSSGMSHKTAFPVSRSYSTLTEWWVFFYCHKSESDSKYKFSWPCDMLPIVQPLGESKTRENIARWTHNAWCY